MRKRAQKDGPLKQAEIDFLMPLATFDRKAVVTSENFTKK